jgi:hypothetical protein
MSEQIISPAIDMIELMYVILAIENDAKSS